MGNDVDHNKVSEVRYTVNVPFRPPAVRRGRLDELEEEVVLRGAVLLRVEVDGDVGAGGRGAGSGGGGVGLSLGNALLGVAGSRLGPPCHGPRDGHPVWVVAGLKGSRGQAENNFLFLCRTKGSRGLLFARLSNICFMVIFLVNYTECALCSHNFCHLVIIIERRIITH